MFQDIIQKFFCFKPASEVANPHFEIWGIKEDVGTYRREQCHKPPALIVCPVLGIGSGIKENLDPVATQAIESFIDLPVFLKEFFNTAVLYNVNVSPGCLLPLQAGRNHHQHCNQQKVSSHHNDLIQSYLKHYGKP